jgi:methyl-accepting chemotaxis protein
MRLNQPVTQQEFLVPEGQLLVSRTDKEGNITYANDVFIGISGYHESELMGQPHNLLRHPDVPESVFADMWRTIESGMPWGNVVKNRRKDGSHYWVEAHVIPYLEGNEIVGYMSVRRAATREQVAAAESAYKAISNGTLALRGGVPESVMRRLNPLENMNPAIGLTLVGLLFTLPSILPTLGVGVADWVIDVASLMIPAILFFSAVYFQKRLAALSQSLSYIAGGKFDNVIQIRGVNMMNQLASQVDIMQTRMAVTRDELRNNLSDACRIQSALESAPSPTLVVDQFDTVIFMNHAMNSFLNAHLERIRNSNPSFDPKGIMGFDVRRMLPLFERAVVAARNVRAQTMALRFGGRDLVVKVNTIYDRSLNDDRMQGIVLSWDDITEELSMQRDIECIVGKAKNGYMDGRLSVTAVDGFYRNFTDRFNEMISALETAVGHITQMSMAAAQGRLGSRMEGKYVGQLGSLQTTMNTAFGNLGSIMLEVQSLMKSVNSIVAHLKSASHEISQQSQEQAAAVEQTTSTMTEIAHGVQLVDADIRKAQQVVVTSTQQAEQVNVAMQNTLVAMDKVQRNSAQIEEIVSLIDSIAFQTNLLALNAAVEAARAGEQGRGFAVVAGEVRSLAQKSSEAAKNIKIMIDTTTHDVAQASLMVKSTSDGIKTVVEGVSSMNVYLSQVVNVMGEQNVAVKEVSKAMASIDNLSQQSAAQSEELAASSGVLEETTQTLAESLKIFQVDAATLRMQHTVASGDFTVARARRAQRIWIAQVLDGLTSVQPRADMPQLLDSNSTMLARWMLEHQSNFGHLSEFAQAMTERLNLHKLAAEAMQMRMRLSHDSPEVEAQVTLLQGHSDTLIASLTAIETAAS